jgi:hypothetical protein
MKTHTHTLCSDSFPENTHFMFRFFPRKHTLYVQILSPKSCRLGDNVEKLVESEKSQMTIQYDACALRAG